MVLNLIFIFVWSGQRISPPLTEGGKYKYCNLVPSGKKRWLPFINHPPSFFSLFAAAITLQLSCYLASCLPAPSAQIFSHGIPNVLSSIKQLLCLVSIKSVPGLELQNSIISSVSRPWVRPEITWQGQLAKAMKILVLGSPGQKNTRECYTYHVKFYHEEKCLLSLLIMNLEMKWEITYHTQYRSSLGGS